MEKDRSDDEDDLGRAYEDDFDHALFL